MLPERELAPLTGSFGFLSLPIELRVEVYKYLLITEYHGWEWETRYVPPFGNSTQTTIDVDYGSMFYSPQAYAWMSAGQRPRLYSAIMHTCKTVYEEASWVLYSKNIFYSFLPQRFHHFLGRIGTLHIASLQFLELELRTVDQLNDWLAVFDLLAQTPHQLRAVMIRWSSGVKPGLGRDVALVRSIGRLNITEKLIIEGYYSKHWPAYLKRSLGVPVEEGCENSREDPLYMDRYASEALKDFLKLHEKHLLDDFQEGTGDLHP